MTLSPHTYGDLPSRRVPARRTRRARWTVTKFADMNGQPVQAVSEILNAEQPITPETARYFSEALGTSPDVWLSLQTAYHGHPADTTSHAAIE